MSVLGCWFLRPGRTAKPNDEGLVELRRSAHTGADSKGGAVSGEGQLLTLQSDPRRGAVAPARAVPVDVVAAGREAVAAGRAPCTGWFSLGMEPGACPDGPRVG